MGQRDTIDVNTGGTPTRQPVVQSLVRALEAGPLDLAAIHRQMEGSGIEAADALASIAHKPLDGIPLLPLRAHNFVRAIGGLWSCLNSACFGEKPADWPFGTIHFTRGDRCNQCSAPVFEIVSCRECGEPWLQAFDHGDRLEPRAVPSDRDDFVSAHAREGDAEEIDDDFPEAVPGEPVDGTPVIIATRPIVGMSAQTIEPTTGALPDKRGDYQVWLSRHADSCPHCHAAATATRNSPLLPFRFGAPFLLQNATPTMLEGVNPHEPSGLALPSDGRQLLSFTDSRQGTARFAANIETQSERGFVRGFIYHAVQQATSGTNGLDRNTLAAQLSALESADAALFADQIASLKAQLAGTNPVPTVSWADAVAGLAAEPEVKIMTKVWDIDRDDRYANNPVALAKMLMLRELARRPRRANSVETLGLAKLVAPLIENLSPSRVPSELSRSGFSLIEWREFLYFMLDGVVRQNFVLDIDQNDARWLLPKNAFLRQVVGPGRDKLNASDQSWPRANASGVKTNAQRVLERVLGLDAESGIDRAAIDNVLQAAFDQLRPLMEGSGSTLALRFDRLALAPIGEGWLCPVTNRVLPRLLFGRTFHGLRNLAPGFDTPPIQIKFPTMPAVFPRDAQARAALAQFVQTETEIANLRTLGVWGNLHDRAAMFAPYIRAEEHSAQQPPHRLRNFEAEFQRGEINLLACSTTMEMGVDIGSVEAVLNTNVPPSIANYRQRIGRAGRRAQSYASSLTFARDLPLDREAFRAPVTYLGRQLRAPRVQLDSDRIVQRHVNALLLATWLHEADGQLTRIRSGEFFGFPQEDGLQMPNLSPASSFVDWLRDPSTSVRMSRSILNLTAGSRIRNPDVAIAATRFKFETALDGFGKAWNGLHQQLGTLAPDARRSVQLQIKRMCREPLLSELGARSVLPSHGFPAGVMQFVTACAANRDRATSDDPSETARNRRYDFPSRPGPVAIREYAPGAEVVIDGLVWTSAGVTLNWQRPAHAEGVREIQSIRYSWTCGDCGESDCGRTDAEACLACGSIELDRQRFLEPAGFRVDWRAQPHADTNVPFYITPEPAQVSARGARWEPLLDPALGRGRATGDGLVFHHSRGAARNGYRICLDCGRAAEDGPSALADHDALMPPKGGAGRCSGNAKQYAITPPLSLGHETLTDVAELQPVSVSDSKVALALASAFREALSRSLGIETRELGVAISRRRTQLGGVTHSIFLYDQSAGGSGYAPQVFDNFMSILKGARSQLSCPVNCESACSACVLVADLFADSEAFDRHGAIEVINNMLDSIATPEAVDVAGPNASISPPVGDVIARRVAAGDTVSIFLPDSFDLTALGDPPLSPAFAAIKAKGASAAVVLSDDAFAGLDDAARAGLRDASHRHAFTIATGKRPLGRNGAPLIATISQKSEVAGFYCREAEAGMPGPRWGTGLEAAIVIVANDAVPPAAMVPSNKLERSVAVGSRVRFLKRDPGRPLAQFGQLFVANVLRPELEAAGVWKPNKLVALSYSDRYLKAPLPAVLALRTLAAIRDILAGKGKCIPVAITTERLRDDRNASQPRYLGQNWLNESDRAEAIEAMADQLSLDCTYTDNAAPHGRKLSITYSDGTEAMLLFDQGFGYWRSQGNDQHNFRASPQTQAKALLDARAFVAGSGDSYVAITAA